ncbi:MAG: spore coat associated protein CotJA [Lachnospiraceae bacterium]|nr:spore coat associated protein CotJA [Lachnospiraceae bacterium]
MTMADAPLAMAYVPYQHWNQTFEPCRGLQLGTIFPCLCKPFCGKGGACR